MGYTPEYSDQGSKTQQPFEHGEEIYILQSTSFARFDFVSIISNYHQVNRLCFFVTDFLRILNYLLNHFMRNVCYFSLLPLTAIVLFSSCKSYHYMYAPVAPNTPMFN